MLAFLTKMLLYCITETQDFFFFSEMLSLHCIINIIHIDF